MRKAAAVIAVGMSALGMSCQVAPMSQADENIARTGVAEQVDRWQQFAAALSRNNPGDMAPPPDSLLSLYEQSDQMVVGWTSGRQTRGYADHVTETAAFGAAVWRLNVSIQSPQYDVLARDLVVVTFRYSTDLQRTDTTREVYSGLGHQVWRLDPDDGVWRLRSHLMSRND
jgi:hypothetical protein